VTNRRDSALLREEVQELTDLLRGDPGWAGLRTTLASRDLTPADVLLISFCEDETKGEYGAFLTVRDRRLFEYERSTAARAPAVFTVWCELHPAAVHGQYPTLPEALRMLDEGT
jgi:hypothetical protein